MPHAKRYAHLFCSALAAFIILCLIALIPARPAFASALDTNYALSPTPAKTNSDMPVSIFVSGSHPAHEALFAHVSFELTQSSVSAQTSLTLKDSEGKVVSQKVIHERFSEDKELADYSIPLYGAELKAEDLAQGIDLKNQVNAPAVLKPGLYTLEVSISNAHKMSVDTYEQSFVIYVYDEVRVPLQTALVLTISMPPLVSPDETPLTDLIEHYEPIAQNLLDVLSELSVHKDARMTLSLPYVTAKDWTYLANLDPDHPSPLTESKQILYHELISDIKNNVDHGRLQLSWQGYSNPSLALMNDSQSNYLEHLQFNPASVFDSRPAVQSPGNLIYAPEKVDVSPESLKILERNEVPYALVHKSQLNFSEPFDNKLSALGYTEEALNLKLIVPSEEYEQAQATKPEALMFEESFKHYLNRDSYTDDGLIIEQHLGLDETTKDKAISTIKRGNNQGWIKFVSLSELVESMSAHKAEATVDSSHLPSTQYSSYFKDYKQANTLFHMYANMIDTHRKNNEKRKIDELSLNMIHAQSMSLVMLDTKTINYRHQLLNETKGYLEDLVASIKITTQNNQIKNASGSVPIQVVSHTPEILHFTLKAHGGPSLSVKEPEYYQNVKVSTLTGENYVSIPVAFTQSNVLEHTLYVDLYTGDFLVKEEAFAIDALRLDIILVLLLISLVFLILIKFMRRRLRQTHGTLPIHDEEIDSELGDIKAGLLEDLVVLKPDDPEALEFFDAPEESNSSLIDDEHIYYHGHQTKDDTKD